jgi:hypothetical protein
MLLFQACSSFVAVSPCLGRFVVMGVVPGFFVENSSHLKS